MVRDYLFKPGDQLGAHTVVSSIGQGGLSEIHLVEDDFGIKKIMKIALPHERLDFSSPTPYLVTKLLPPLERTIHEANIQKDLNHPLIARPIGIERTLPYGTAGLLLQYVEGAQTLREVVAKMPIEWDVEGFIRGGTFDPEERLLQLIKEYDEGLRDIPAHRQGGTGERSAMGGYDFIRKLSDGKFTNGKIKLEGLMRRVVLGANMDIFFQRLKIAYIGLFAQMETGIEYLMSRGIVHKDVTANNFIVDKMLGVKMLDFGIASRLDQSDGIPGARYPTPPEVYRGELSRTYDLFGLGVIISRVVTGHHPFSETDDKEEAFSRGKEWSRLSYHPDSIILPFSIDAYEHLIRQGINHFETPETKSRQLALEVARVYHQEKPALEIDDAAEQHLKRQVGRWFTYLNINPTTRATFADGRFRPPTDRLTSIYQPLSFYLWDVKERKHNGAPYVELRPKP